MSVFAFEVTLLALFALLILGGIEGVMWIKGQFDNWRRARHARIETELDRTQNDLRSTLLLLAAEMNDDAHEARKALIQASLDAAKRKGKSSNR